MNNRKEQKDCWDILQIIGTLSIPVVIAISGLFINNTIKEKEIKLKYIELAISILRDEPNQETIGLREWAISLVQKYSIEKFSEGALEELKRSALPYEKVLKDTKGVIIRDTTGKPIFTK